MPETLEDLVMMQPPTADRPLLGTLILVVEDSRHACEALRLICQRSGARIRRAESLASAERHLRTYRPRIAVIDLGLPDGSGLDLIDRLSRSEPHPCGLIAISGDETLAEAAIEAGADCFLPKPVRSIEAFQKAALALVPADQRPARRVKPPVDTVAPDLLALRDDLAFAADLLLGSPDAATLDYLAAFLDGLAKCTGDRGLAEIGQKLRGLQNDGCNAECPRRLAEEIVGCAARLSAV